MNDSGKSQWVPNVPNYGLFGCSTKPQFDKASHCDFKFSLTGCSHKFKMHFFVQGLKYSSKKLRKNENVSLQ